MEKLKVKEKDRRIKRSTIEVAAEYLIIAILALAFIVPFIWLILSSFKTSQDLFRTPP